MEGYLTTDDGVRLFFEQVGSGPKIVVVPNGMYLRDDFQQLSKGRTLIFYDVRNRGLSDRVDDASKLTRGIHNDVDDLEAVRRHFGIPQIDAIGHSYMGLMLILYAMKYPKHVLRIVQIGPAQPDAAKQYPPHLKWADATSTEVFSKLAQMQRERGSEDPVEFCKKVWSVLRSFYVVNAADAGRINWGRCDLPNERNFMQYWTASIYPSIQNLTFPAEELAKVTVPVLTVHGTKDRSAPYGGGVDWAAMLPNARLLTIENAGHAPWIEAPSMFDAIQIFLD